MILKRLGERDVTDTERNVEMVEVWKIKLRIEMAKAEKERGERDKEN